MFSHEYSLAKLCFDTAANEPCKVCPLSAYRSPRFLADPAKLTEEHAKSKSCDPEVVFKWKQIESLPTYEPGFQGKYGFLQKYIEFQKVIGDGFYDIGDYHDFRRESGWYTDDDKVKAMWIRYNASIGMFKPADFIQPIFDDWTHYAEKEFDLGVPVHSNSGGIWLCLLYLQARTDFF